MIRGRRLVAAMLATMALVALTGGSADAAQCGNGPGGLRPGNTVRRRGEGKGRRWHGDCRADAGELCECDHRRRSRPAQFQSVARPVSRQARRLRIVARGRALKQSQAALFASIQQRYGVPPGPLIAIWGMETGFGSQRGNQNMLSSIATLAYDCRRPEFFTDQLYAALKLIDRGVLSAARAARCTAKSARPSSCPRTSWPTAPAISTSPPTR